MPRRPAVSRSTWTCSRKPLFCASEATSLQYRGRPELVRQPGSPIVDLLRVGAGERVLVLRAAQPRRDLDVLHRLEKDDDAGDRGDRLLQPLDDGRHRRLALVARAQRDGEPAGIRRGVDRRHADDGDDPGHVGVLADRGLDLGLQPLHLGERDLLPALHHREDEAGILQRQESLRDDDVEPDGRDQRGGGHQQRQGLVAQHPFEASPIDLHRPVDRADGTPVTMPPRAGRLRLMPQQAAAHHRRQA